MANIGNLVVKLQAQTSAFKKGMADARQAINRFASGSKKATDDVSDGLTEAAKAAGIYRDSLGKLREASGRFVTSEKMAELGIENWNKSAKSSTGIAGKLSKAFEDLAAKIKKTTGVSLNLPSLSGAIGAIKTAMLAGTAAATGFFAAMTVKAGTIKELDQLAKVTGVGVENLQKWQFAGKAVGIETDKMADIFRDASEKLGELAATGGGEAKELFEKLGLDAREFANIPIDEAILRIGSSMDELTKNERNALLEMLASDARELIPLLENDAEGFRKLAAEAEATGNVLSEGGVAAAVRFRNAWGDLTQRFSGFMTQLTGAMAGPLEQIVIKFREWIDSLGGVEAAAKLTANGIIDMISGGIKGLQAFVKALGRVEIAWKKIQMATLAVLDATLQIVKYSPASVIGKVTGQFDVGAMQAQVAAAGTDIAGQVLELERLQGQGGWAETLGQHLEDLRLKINESRTSEETLAEETKKGAEQTKRNTEAMGDLAKGLGVKGVKGSGGSTASSEITSTTAGQKMGEAFIHLLNKQKFIAGSSSLGTSSDPVVFQRAVQALMARYEGLGGYDTDKMRQMAAEVVQAQEAKNVGSITITVKSDNGDASGEVTGDTAFLSKLASTLQSVSTAV